ncbi:hypothetical protein SGLAD_v1c08370 [Spiroplasma gladiatoris]|uniref:Uncharacterized protein n=1 Tax=Spiroplasma gladiatoris TaxID=2143 RepID=A0A4P7AK41_9MOLU|nr:hypothetical protein [Spiroplasma gladiatoris]QBQ08036.1 hypothetical protein SGLAD_v1c08370 [Spiroplasma gladiatoris]
MKRQIRSIDNSGWITNVFNDKEYIYFTDAIFNTKYSSLYKISKKIVLENLKNKNDLGRYFLANPLIENNNNAVLLSSSEIEFIKKEEYYIQNYFLFKNNEYISFIIDKKVYTKNINLNEPKEFQILNYNYDFLIAKKNEEVFFLDENLNIVKTFKKEIISLIAFEKNFVVLDINMNVWLTDFELNFLEKLDSSNNFKNIFYLNKNNILISYKDRKNTIVLNYKTKLSTDFVKEFLFRAFLLEENILITKSIYDISDNINMSSLIKFIY